MALTLPRPRAGLTFDTGALIALERSEKHMRAVVLATLHQGLPITVPSPVLVEWWKGGGRQRDILASLEVEPLSDVLARIAGDRVVLVDSAAAVSEQVAAELARRGMLAVTASEISGKPEAGDHFCVTDASGRFERIAGDFLGRRIELELVDIGNSAAGPGSKCPERSEP